MYTCKSHPAEKIIDLTAIEEPKAKAQTVTCLAAAVTTIGLSVASVVGGIALPVLVNHLTPVTCWIAIGLVALGGLFAVAARWISRNAL